LVGSGKPASRIINVECDPGQFREASKIGKRLSLGEQIDRGFMP
jgi:hypothetical protein